MSWVRYDDQFHMNLKVTAVIAEDAGAIALHVLANTWSNTQKHLGFIPAHQPGMLLCDKRKGGKWAALLVKHGLWHRRGDECEQCREEYADLTVDTDGFVIHNAKEYRAPARDRTTPGTPSDLSEKRRQAGRAGGKVSAAKREQAKQRAEAKQANGVSKTSNLPPAGVSPVVKASNEALTPDPVPGLFASEEANPPPSAGAASPSRADAVPAPGDLTITQRSKLITDAYYAAEPLCNWNGVNGIVIKAIKAEKWPDCEIQDALLRLANDNRGVSVETLRRELAPPTTPSRDTPPPSRNSKIIDAAMERAKAAEAAAAAENRIPRGAISA